ncbi:hypothetical protein FVE85_4679 [Porphyridium purpureum]|uniref:Uncharacterized protein n=1 Tax=Porphyridium purpureum TaxID=35688 RepID=A0A5J4YRU9_PORPP|nr:hypothetical protein FVE85_4679 [Porphyridium purpureum]|eukprot:POR1021..scf236_6
MEREATERERDTEPKSPSSVSALMRRSISARTVPSVPKLSRSYLQGPRMLLTMQAYNLCLPSGTAMSAKMFSQISVLKRSLAAKDTPAWEWNLAMQSELAYDRENPKWVQYAVFPEFLAKDLVLRFEVRAVEQNAIALMNKKPVVVGFTETSLAVAVGAENGVLDCELENEENGELTGAVLYVFAHRIRQLAVRRVNFKMTWSGVGMLYERCKFIIWRRIPGSAQYQTPIFVSDTISKPGTTTVASLPAECLAEGLDTRLRVEFLDWGKGRKRIGEFQGLLGAFREIPIPPNADRMVFSPHIKVNIFHGLVNLRKRKESDDEWMFDFHVIIHREAASSAPQISSNVEVQSMVSRQGSSSSTRSVSATEPLRPVERRSGMSLTRSSTADAYAVVGDKLFNGDGYHSVRSGPPLPGDLKRGTSVPLPHGSMGSTYATPPGLNGSSRARMKMRSSGGPQSPAPSTPQR